jgi:dipeptidyl aminopeptidase/acylaminoacyl peptidase
MGPYAFGWGYTPVNGLGREPRVDNSLAVPQKAENADVYVFQRLSESEPPNLYATRDFKTLVSLTKFERPADVNWLTTELVNFKGLDGKPLKGILYKPENFDAKKKYPVIVWYYEKNSTVLHTFIPPEYSADNINIPYYVSNGYLVFVPDIVYKVGEMGEGVVNSVVSAANMLTKLPYVDASRLGVQGHSFGGYQTAYLITRTPIFAAAMEAAGPLNPTSTYGMAIDLGGLWESWLETGQGRMGSTPWNNTAGYVKYSSVFHADKVRTPLLMMHNKLDGAWEQVVEFFGARRRQKKPVWLLQYDYDSHSLVEEKNKKDYTIRMKQYFDYYLQGAFQPKWMTEGVPASRKGLDSGLELDKSGRKP